MDKQPTVSKRWKSYRDGVMNPAAPPLQVHECQLAFYAGSFAVLKIMFGMAKDPAMSLDEGAAALEALLQEVKEFAATVLRQGDKDEQKLH